MSVKAEKRDPELVARGERLKKIRAMLDMTVHEFAELCGSGSSTVSQWENGRIGGLAAKSARCVIEALKKTPIVCSETWLLYGDESDKNAEPHFKSQLATTGTPLLPPSLSRPATQYRDPHPPLLPMTSIKEEVDAFAKSDPRAVVLSIQDDAMLPFFRPGDFIGGYRLPVEETRELLGEICIAQTLNGQILARRLDHGSTENIYRLSAVNSTTTAEHFLLETELVCVAMISRLWRP